MLTRTDIADSKLSFSKDLIADQTFTGITIKLGTSDRVFTVGEGLGVVTADSMLALLHIGGFDDQRVTGVMKWIAPSTPADHEFGVIARFQTIDETADEAYYFARVDDGQAELVKKVGSSFITLSSGAFVVPSDTDVTITLEVVGSALSATFDAGGSPATVNLATIDTDIPSGGLMGFRTRSAAGYCSSILAEQL